jgi:hypothetical protein
MIPDNMDQLARIKTNAFVQGVFDGTDEAMTQR